MNSILEAYKPIANIIAGMFGPQCEVVLHDLSMPERSVIYVVNGSVTKREVGQPFDHFVKNVLLNRNFKDDYLTNYVFQTPDGKMIKSASAIIRDEKKEIVGMLCINYDIGMHQQLQQQLAAFLNIEPETIVMNEPEQDVIAIIDELIKKIIGTQDIQNLSRKQIVEIIRFMDEKGIFLVRGSIDKVAEIIGVSKVTIYSYLDEARGKR